MRRSGRSNRHANEEPLRRKFARLTETLDERSRRLVVAAEARALGHGGIAKVQRASGVARSTISRGIRELEGASPRDAWRTRRYGGGRKRLVERDPTLLPDLVSAVGPRRTSGHPRSRPSAHKSVRALASELEMRGHRVSYPVVAKLLKEIGLNRPRRRRRKFAGRSR